jgi:HPt (histidine-containing phosphotransfer) domain-containing protein
MEPTAEAEALLRLPVDAAPAANAPIETGTVETLIDLAHLARMTLGEMRLEAEVLRLFDRQAEILLAHMRDATPTAAAAFAHTLKGSASGIGAWGVAVAAEAVETSAKRGNVSATAGAVVQLATAVAAVKVEIAELLHQHHAREE